MKALVKEMKQKRVTREQLAKAIGVSRQTVFNWISGSCSPSFENMDALKDLGYSETACLAPDQEVEV